MSYVAAEDTLVQVTPMYLDIVAARAVYGAPTAGGPGDTTGDNTYFVDSASLRTIWDDGGSDTIIWNDSADAHLSLSFYSPGSINDPSSNFGWSGITNGVFDQTDWRFFIAPGTQIENLTGGSGNDYLEGNSADNVLKGGAGQDYLDGGNGSDTADYSANTANGTIDLALGTANFVGFNYTETLVSIENVWLGSGNDTIILSNQNVNNLVNGGSGTDTVYVAYSYNSGYTISGTAANLAMSGSAGTDTFSLVEFVHFSNNVTVSASDLVTPGPNQPPVVAPVLANRSMTAGDDLLWSSLFTVTDQENDTIILFSVDESNTSGVGSWYRGSTPIAGQDFVSPSDFANLHYHAAGPGTETIYFQAREQLPSGSQWSGRASVDITVTAPPNQPPVVAPVLADRSMTVGDDLVWSNLFTVTDQENDSIVLFSVDESNTSGIGSWYRGGTPIAGQDFVSPSDFANLYYHATGPGTETIYFQAREQLPSGWQWSDRVSVNITVAAPLPVISIAALSADKPEGSNGGTTPFTFTVTRTGDTSGASSVIWTLFNGQDPTADLNDFIEPVSGTLNWAAGDSNSKTITLNAVADATVEPTEFFNVGLASNGVTGATIGTATAGGTIQNDDQPLPVLAISAVSADKAEGNGGGTTPFTFTVTRTGDTSGPSSVIWTLFNGQNPTADLNDFIEPVSGTLNWATGDGNAKTITLNVAADATVEPTEFFNVGLASNSVTGATIGTATAGGTIQNDDQANQPPTAVALSGATVSIVENTSTAAHIKVADIAVTDDVLGSNTLGVTGTDAAFFEIVGTSLYLKAGTALDFESKASYAVTVTVDDSAVGGTPDASTNYTLVVTNVNEAPTNITASALSVNEIIPNGTLVGTVAAQDVDSSSFTYTLLNDAGGRFTIDNNGNVTVAKGLLLDFEQNASHLIRVRATDLGNLSFDKDFPVTVNDVNPELVVSDAAAHTFVGGALGDVFHGGLGNDTLDGRGGDDILDGGPGADTMIGGGGNDTYKFAAGYGQDVIVNGDSTNGSASSQLLLGAGLTPEKLWRVISGNDLVFQVLGTDDKVAIQDWYLSSSKQLQFLTLSDGSQIGTAAITQLAQDMGDYQLSHPSFSPATATAQPSDWTRTVTGTSGSDTFDAVFGNSTLIGNGGNDTYKFNAGYGQAVIVNGDSTNGSASSQLLMGAGLGPSNLWRAISGTDMVFQVLGTNDKITIKDWYLSSAKQLQYLTLSDGSQIGTAAITSLAAHQGDYQQSHPSFNPATANALPNDPILQAQLAADWAHVVTGTAGNDTFTGTSGIDVFYGNGGVDTYNFGAGQDLISNGNGSGGSSSQLVLASGIGPGNLWRGISGTDMVFQVLNTNDTVTIKDWYLSSAKQLQFLTLSDGSQIGTAAITSLAGHQGDYQQSHPSFNPATATALPNDPTLQAQLAADWTHTFTGSGGNDTFTGTSGIDVFYGNGGVDSYNFGVGQDVISNGNGSGGASSQLVLASGIGPSNLWRVISGTDMTFQVLGTNDTVTIKDWYLASAKQLQSLTLSDGSQIGTAAITSLAGHQGDYQQSHPSFNPATATALPSDATLLGHLNQDWTRTITGTSGNDTINAVLGNNTLNGNAGNDQINGGAGNDTITGGIGNDVLNGGIGDDTFVFTNGDGVDIASDFVAGNSSGDTVDLHGYGIAAFAALQPFMSQSGADVIINFDAGNQITLQNVTLGQLNQNDFLLTA